MADRNRKRNRKSHRNPDLHYQEAKERKKEVKMTTVAITSDLEPYLESLRSYLARGQMGSSTSSSSSLSPRPGTDGDEEGGAENAVDSDSPESQSPAELGRKRKCEMERKVKKYTVRPVGKETIPRSSLP